MVEARFRSREVLVSCPVLDPSVAKPKTLGDPCVNVLSPFHLVGNLIHGSGQGRKGDPIPAKFAPYYQNERAIMCVELVPECLK